MRSLSVVVFVSLVALGHALTFSTLAITLMSLGSPADAFFGMFRRRSAPKVREESLAPQGPVGFNNDFQRRQSFFGSGFNFLQGGGRPFWSPFAGFQGLSGGFPGGQPFFPGGQPVRFAAQPSQFPAGQFPPNFADRPAQMRAEDSSEPQLNTEEAESFFTLLAETDESKCISRLVCELGADPQGAGELGTTISEIIGSLTDFPEGSRVSEYNEVLKSGKNKGISFCGAQFSACDEESYVLMKNSQAEQVAETES